MIDALLLVLVLLWCWTLLVALARSCIVPADQCRIGVLSVAVVTVVMDSARGTNTVLCCMWESLINWHRHFCCIWRSVLNCMVSLHTCLYMGFVRFCVCRLAGLGWYPCGRLKPATRIPPQPATPKLQHTSKQEHTTNVVIQ